MRGGGNKAPHNVTISQIIWSGIASFLGIFLIASIAKFTSFSMLNQFFLIGSFGASAVLIYAAPKVDYAQPRNLVGGHLLSAFVGVCIIKFTSLDLAMSAALAVSLAIMLMHFTKTIHPPGGATALIAVIGGDEIYQFGFMFILNPVVIGALLLLLTALLVNNLSNDQNRHYPKTWL